MLNLRDNTQYKEIIEMKKVYKHPLYEYPSLYNDVAVIELGRRIEYDFDKYGDSPTCMARPEQTEIEGKIATVQGYGVTENGTKGYLLEANVTVISNELCKEYLDYNGTQRVQVKKKINNALSNGLNYGLFCTQGYQDENGVFTGSCKGDSGGPLKTRFLDSKKDTLIGIVSGGVGCGSGIPGWYTKVSFYAPWIDCIIETSRETGGARVAVEKKCDEVARNLVPPCVSQEDLIFEDFDLRSGDVDIFAIDSCNEV